ncbi:hypothetical protein CAPTEDRAFT_227356 [Capitella teleta]|uniref:WD repeat-containing protein 97 n=1 Tax=Capitella teleta TaxID=283909 RepID=R7TIU0_CAPTE|nr:hypothetical protein CAPTEDRAFT_227356 [Capitella teleta]|eukprot:ELT93743.1 hypothetical protein CAPTEDRAFT_227356 [Capitella teleta]
MTKSRQGSAQSRVDDMLRVQSRMSYTETKPPPEEDEPKPKYAWRLIRQCVRYAIDASMKADTSDLDISHGIHQNKKLSHVRPIVQMIYNKTDMEYITLDGHDVRVFMADGRKKQLISPPVPFNRLIFAYQTSLFVGWNYNEDGLHLFSKEFQLNSTSSAFGAIHAAVYNENIGEIVTVGSGYLTSWVFRYGSRHLLPRKTSTEGLGGDQPPFHLLVLEETASRSQKAYAANDHVIASYNLNTGELLTIRKELHTRPLTALLFFNPLKYLITGAKDGSIKVWNEFWHLQLVFVGHGAAVNSIAAYPFGPNIMSVSEDKTLRVWGLETCDQVNRVDVEEPISYIGSMINHPDIFGISGNSADLWRVKHVHKLHTRVGHHVFNIKATDHPSFPVHSVLLCRDASVRILCPVSGNILTTLLMDRERKLVDAVYAIAQDRMFAVFGNGDIIKSDTSTNPCTILSTWKYPEPKKACNYLLVYEYIISSDLDGDAWGAMKRAIASKGLSLTTPDSGRTTPALQTKTQADRTLLLGGRKDGHICVLDWETGEVEFEIEAHGVKGVLSMVANSKSDQLISAGLGDLTELIFCSIFHFFRSQDNIIKIWRLYPYAQESLALLMSFYCAHTPLHMSILKNNLAVAFQEHSSATYSVVMYNMNTRNRLDHSPEDDHMDNITALSSCPKMNLLASSSNDGTIRIWNEKNHLCRVISMNTVPSSLCFCSQRGDLLVGVNSHIHRIDYKEYMPKAYRFKMISMKFPETPKKDSLPYDENLLKAMLREDVKRLQAARSSFKFTHFIEVLTDEENAEALREKRLRQKAVSLLNARDSELAKIRDGELEAKKKPRPTKATKREAFDKYLSIFYNREKVELPPDDDSPDYSQVLLEKPKVDTSYQAETGPAGFFPTPGPPPPETNEDAALCQKLRQGGFIPNSVLARLLFPNKPKEEQKEIADSVWRPPKLTKQQLDSLNARKKLSYDPFYKKQRLWKMPHKLTQSKQVMDGSFEDRTIVLDYDDDGEEKQKQTGTIHEEEEEEEEVEEEEVEEEEEVNHSHLNNLLSKVAEREPETEPEPEPEVEETESAAQPKSILKSSGDKPKAKGISFKPKKPVIKYIAPKPASPLTPPPKTPTPPPPVKRIPTPPPKTPSPPPSPLPGFISQFKGTQWFDKYFPNCNEKTLAKPWSVSALVEMLAKVLRFSEYVERIEILKALKMLQREEGIPNPEVILKALYSVFGAHCNPPSCLDPTQKTFINEGIKMMQTLGVYDRDFYVELMVQILEADASVRKECEMSLKLSGLKDPHSCLTKELDSWDIWQINESDRTKELRKKCGSFLDKWMDNFKHHVEDSIERMRKGQGVTGRVDPSMARGAMSSSRSILRKHAEADHSNRLTVTFDQAPDLSVVENATYLEALNYYCEITTEKLLEGIRTGKLDTSGEVKNTVLVLPKVSAKTALVRLGETHTSKCRANRETSYTADLRLPPVTSRGKQPLPGQLYGFPSAINLPMKQVVMNPFPCSLDQLDEFYHEPVLLTLKTAQKYFIPDRSVVTADVY